MKNKYFVLPPLILVALVAGCSKPLGNNVIDEQDLNGDKENQQQEINEVVNDENQATSSVNEIDTSGWLTYRNDKYGFEVKYPNNKGKKQEVHLNTFDYEVGQKDKCKDCALAQFVVPTEGEESCAFPRDCGKSMLFTIRIRDIESWNKNNFNKNYACINEGTVIKKTDNYVYNICPFSISEISGLSTPPDIIELLNKSLSKIKESFKVY